MAIARVQGSGKVHRGPGGSLAASFGSLPSAGNLVTVSAISYGNGGAIPAADFTDNQGNTYQIAAASLPNSGSATIAYAANIGSPSGTFTVTWNPTTGASYLVFAITEWSGMATTSLLDGTFVDAASGTAPTVATGTTTNANDLIIAVGYNDDQSATSTFTKDAAFTEEFIEQDATQYIVGEASYRIVSSTGNYSSTWTTSNFPWSAAIAAFKAGSGGGGGGGGVSVARYNCLLRM